MIEVEPPAEHSARAVVEPADSEAHDLDNLAHDSSHSFGYEHAAVADISSSLLSMISSPAQRQDRPLLFGSIRSESILVVRTPFSGQSSDFISPRGDEESTGSAGQYVRSPRCEQVVPVEASTAELIAMAEESPSFDAWFDEDVEVQEAQLDQLLQSKNCESAHEFYIPSALPVRVATAPSPSRHLVSQAREGGSPRAQYHASTILNRRLRGPPPPSDPTALVSLPSTFVSTMEKRAREPVTKKRATTVWGGIQLEGLGKRDWASLMVGGR